MTEMNDTVLNDDRRPVSNQVIAHVAESDPSRDPRASRIFDKRVASEVDRPQSSPSPERRGGPHPSMVLIHNLLSAVIRTGSLTLVGPDGRPLEFGQGEPSITVRIADWSTVWTLSLNPDLALGEAFMDGKLEVEGGSVYDLLDLCLANLGRGAGHWILRLQALGQRLVRRIVQHNPVSAARANVAHHYDLSDTLYELFLDAGRQYSCAYYKSPFDTLESAQQAKQRHIAAKLLLRPGQRILDIGSGWGGLALHLACSADVDVTGVTLSTEQHEYANRRVNEAGLGDRVRFRLEDYRRAEGRFDRIVSVGMFEHVGVGHHREYFEKLRDLLTDDGVALVHTIGSAHGPGAANPWINKYIFPGGYTPALSEIVPIIERTGLHITDVEVLRLHYAATLRDWRERFMEHRNDVAAIYDERFCRMWEFYLASCEAAFRHAGLVVFQIQLSKRVDTVPLTRDYIGDWERRHGAGASVDLPNPERAPAKARGSEGKTSDTSHRQTELRHPASGHQEVACGRASGAHPGAQQQGFRP